MTKSRREWLGSRTFLGDLLRFLRDTRDNVRPCGGVNWQSDQAHSERGEK